MLSLESTSEALPISFHFSGGIVPVFIASDVREASLLIIRLTICSFDISRLNTAMEVSWYFFPTFVTMFIANEVLPIPGRAARIIRSERFRP